MDSVLNRRRVSKSEVIEYGIVEKVSLQGDYLYAVVRSEGIPYQDEDGRIIFRDTYLFGSNGVPEQELLLADVLIPTDILPSMVTMDFKFFIGKKVEVIIDGRTPRVVLLSRCASFLPARKVSVSDIQTAREFNTGRQMGQSAKRYLNGIGFDEKHVDALLSEKYIDIANLDRDILTYGANLQWDVVLESDDKNKTRQDMSKKSNFSYVSGLTGGQMTTKSCYIPVLSIGGKV